MTEEETAEEDKEKDGHIRDHFFESEVSDSYYQFTIEEFNGFVNLKIFRTYKHPMISAAKSGDLDQFIEHFTDTEKMREFALGEAIFHEHWNITKYLIMNHHLKKNPTYWAIRYDNDVMIRKLLELNVPLDENWLAYCVYCDSEKVTEELLINRECHLKISEEEYNTDWLKKELRKKDNRTAAPPSLGVAC